MTGRSPPRLSKHHSRGWPRCWERPLPSRCSYHNAGAGTRTSSCWSLRDHFGINSGANHPHRIRRIDAGNGTVRCCGSEVLHAGRPRRGSSRCAARFGRARLVPDMNRRQFLGSLAASVVAGVGAARLVVDPSPRTFAETPTDLVPTSGPAAPSALLPPPPMSARIPLPGGGALMKIPGDGDLLALTVDDGVNSDVVRAYTQFAKDTGVRLTYFVSRTPVS